MQNKPLVKQVALVAIPGLDSATRASLTHALPFASSHLGAPATLRIDNGKATFAASLDRILTVPPSKSQRKEIRSKKRVHDSAGAAPPQPPAYYALTMDNMRDLDFPMPVRACLM